MKTGLPNNVKTSNKIKAAWRKRAAQLHDGMNQAANIAVKWMIDNEIKAFVLGKNDGWKEDFGKKVPTHRKGKQDFVFMPFEYLIARLTEKCQDAGIELVLREESYTSKASLVDADVMPVFNKAPDDGQYPAGSFSDVVTRKVMYQFSGTRVSRGLYRSKATMIGDKGLILNADVNGAGNILRKEFGSAFDGVSDWRFLMCPVRVKLHVVSGSWGSRTVSRDAFC